MKYVIKISVLFLIITSAILHISCSVSNMAVPPDETKPVYSTLFKDSLYKNGFRLRSTSPANHNYIDTLDYCGKATGNPLWTIDQWKCINNDLKYAECRTANGRYEYHTGVKGNMVAVNTTKGIITLELNASTEYGLNGITSNPRKQGEPWPALLLAYRIPPEDIVKISDKKEIRMAVDYKVTKLEDKMPPGTIDPKLHSATFQWYIIVQNRNKSSVEYGRYLWFGLTFHDKRHGYAPMYATPDVGTGFFIYKPEMEPLMVKLGPAEVNKRFTVDIDVLPAIRKALTVAQQHHFLTKTNWEDLYIGATNIGWEVSGTYDVAVDIYSIEIKYIEKQK